MSLNDLTIYNLASGSNANALLVRSRGVTLLVDSGLPIRKLQAALSPIGIGVDDIDVVFITHEHVDHVRSLPQLLRRGTMVVTSTGTARAMRLKEVDFVPAVSDRQHDIAGLSLLPVTVSHDAADPLGLLVDTGEVKVAVMTDLGSVDERHIEVMSYADLIILEANHDLDMLRLGPYPPHLKRRVMSGVGHLSNAECGKALRSALNRSSQQNPRIWLAHLSVTNNRPVTAATTVRQHIPGARISVLPRHEAVDLLATSGDYSPQTRPIQPALFTDLLK